MKPTSILRRSILSALAGLCLLPHAATAATMVVGTGSDVSYVLLESPNLGTLTYEVHYDVTSGPYDSKFLLDMVRTSDLTLTMAFTNWGTLVAPNYNLDSITRKSVTEAGSFTPPFVYWAQWVSGGAAGYPTASPVPSGTWGYGSGISTPYRVIAPGSWDAFVYSDGSAPPSLAPVPEPSSWWFAPLGALLVFHRRKG